MPRLPRETLAALIVGWALGLCLPIQALAWGALGHRVVASVAEEHLTPAAREGVQHLLALEPGATLTSVSTWADEHRNPSTSRWHYVNMPPGNCTYEASRDCPNGNCVVGVIQTQLEILKSGASDESKLQALKYLVHFVGDIHQPLHAGHAEDRGGNKYQININRRGTNLHAYWDTGLLKQISHDENEWISRLSTVTTPIHAQVLNPVEVAQESCRIVETEGFYPPHKVQASYGEVYAPVAQQRLLLAGLRLAQMLNEVWR